MEGDWAEQGRGARRAPLRPPQCTLRDPIACDFFIGWEVDRGREESVLCWLDCEGWKGEKSADPPGRQGQGPCEIWRRVCAGRVAAKEVRIDEAAEGGGPTGQAVRGTAADRRVGGASCSSSTCTQLLSSAVLPRRSSCPRLFLSRRVRHASLRLRSFSSLVAVPPSRLCPGSSWFSPPGSRGGTSTPPRRPSHPRRGEIPHAECAAGRGGHGHRVDG